MPLVGIASGISSGRGVLLVLQWIPLCLFCGCLALQLVLDLLCLLLRVGVCLNCFSLSAHSRLQFRRSVLLRQRRDGSPRSGTVSHRQLCSRFPTSALRRRVCGGAWAWSRRDPYSYHFRGWWRMDLGCGAASAGVNTAGVARKLSFCPWPCQWRRVRSAHQR